ncbi:protein FAM227B [Ranitomeya variabilis]|uniref:protein FAM227B n=1 Tax=Ranitomeya variabilis TaxID=490064 RepID=UPI004056F468
MISRNHSSPSRNQLQSRCYHAALVERHHLLTDRKSKNMQKPPAMFIEFLNFKHLKASRKEGRRSVRSIVLQKDWPEIPLAEEPLHKELVPVPRYSLEMIHKEFIMCAPFCESAFADVESKIDKNMAFLNNYASQMLCLPALDNDQDSSTKVFLTEADVPELSQNRQEVVKKCHKFVEARFLAIPHHKYIICESQRVGTAMGTPVACVFANLFLAVFEERHVTGPQNPFLNHIRMYLRFADDVFMVWDGEESSFNEFVTFLNNNNEDNMLLTAVYGESMLQKHGKDYTAGLRPATIVFRQMCPDYLSQAIFTAFYKAFPQSRALFNGEIKAEIVDLIFRWVSGIKPVPCSWEKWDLDILECQKNSQNSNEKVITSQNRNLTDVKRRLEFNLDDLLEEARQPNLPRILGTEDRYIPKKRYSHSMSPGPEFHHALFQLDSHSLLVSNYLKKHHFTGCIHGISRHRIKRTEIVYTTPVGPTYEDIIKETQSARTSLQQDYDILETKTEKELAEIQQQNVNVKYKIEKMKQELSRGVKLNSTLLLERLQKMPFSSKLFRKKNLTIQNVLDADNENEQITDQTLVML